jgi:hypothetical protein
LSGRISGCGAQTRAETEAKTSGEEPESAKHGDDITSYLRGSALHAHGQKGKSKESSGGRRGSATPPVEDPGPQ